MSFGSEMRFINYIMDKAEYKNAIQIMKKINPGTFNISQRDSLNYFLGWAYHNSKINDSAALYLAGVSENSPFYFKSKFYQSLNYSYLKEYEKSEIIVGSIKSDTSENYGQLKNFEEAGIYLLKKDYRSFDSTAVKFNYTNPLISKEQKELLEYARQLKKHKKKSPLVAGILSTVVPGLGKIYAGKKGQGLSAFLSCAMFGAMAAENIIKNGYNSPQAILFESLFSMFYIGNIWGSVLSVKLSHESFLKSKQDEILVTMHIPLRRVFGQ